MSDVSDGSKPQNIFIKCYDKVYAFNVNGARNRDAQFFTRSTYRYSKCCKPVKWRTERFRPVWVITKRKRNSFNKKGSANGECYKAVMFIILFLFLGRPPRNPCISNESPVLVCERRRYAKCWLFIRTSSYSFLCFGRWI